MDYTQYFLEASTAQQAMVNLSAADINRALLDLAEAVESNANMLLDENQRDLDRMSIEEPKYDRLKLTAERIQSIASDIRNVADLTSPIGEIILQKTLSNDLELTKVRVALGVVSVIYEARPNVTLDVFT